MSLIPKRLFSVVVTLSVLLGAGYRASADEVRVETRDEFFPRTEFQTEHGYFRTENGRYYHYDKDRDGWHRGRSHREAMRHHRDHDHDHDSK